MLWGKGKILEDNKEKRTSVKAEQMFDILCLIASYGILFLLPQAVGFFFYLIFGVSAFLFCIGFFRLGLSFDAPAGAKMERFAKWFFAVYGVLINTTGLYVIHQDQGSGRSIVIATLLLIEALVLYTMASSSAQTPGKQRLTAIVFRGAAVLLIVIGIVLAVRNHFNESSIVIATMLVIECIVLWAMGGGSNPFNSTNSDIKTVPGLRTPIEQLQQEFAGVETQLGYPWVGKVKTIDQDCIIYGPSKDGYVVYGYYLYGSFYVAGSTNPLFPEAEDAQSHVVTEIPDSSGRLLNQTELTEAYTAMFTRYAESGSVGTFIYDPPQH